VAPFVAGASVVGPLVPGRLSLVASGRVSTVGQIAARYVEAPLPFEFGDVFAKAYFTASPTSRFSVTALRTWDRGGIGDPDSSMIAGARGDEVRYANTAVGARYVLLPSSAPLLAQVHVSYSDLRTALGPSRPASDGDARRLTRTSGISSFDATFDLTYVFRRGGLKAGGFLRQLGLGSSLGGQFQGVATDADQVTVAGLYLQPEFRFGGLRVAPGVRVTTLPQVGQAFVEPRLRAAFETGPHRLSVAAGLYNQPVIGVSDRRDATSVFTAYTLAPDGQTPRAAHLIAGYHLRAAEWAGLSVEGFAKTMDDLSVAEFTAVPRLTTAVTPASGRAHGVDLRAELARRGATLLVSYGLSFVEYETVSQRNQLLFGDERFTYRPGHDRRHQATVVASVPVRGFTVAARFQFGSGLPFSRALGFDQYLFPDGAPDVYTDPGTPRVLYERPFNALLPAYHRLDVTVERVFPFRAAQLTVQAGLLNAYDRANLFAYDLFTLRRVDQLPVVPTIGLRLDTR
jgi:hypothetical protein